MICNFWVQITFDVIFPNYVTYLTVTWSKDEQANDVNVFFYVKNQLRRIFINDPLIIILSKIVPNFFDENIIGIELYLFQVLDMVKLLPHLQ